MTIRRHHRRSAAALVVSLVAVGLSGCSHGKQTPPEQIAAQSFLDAIAAGAVPAAAQRTDNAAAATPTITQSLAGLGAGAKAALQVSTLTARTKNSATADYTARWTLPGVATPWSYSARLPMVKQGKNWLVSWKAADLYPTLPEGAHLSVVRTQPTRAALQDASGAPLFTPTAVVTVGINPSAVVDLPSLAATLAGIPALQTTAAEITADVKAAKPDQFVPVITLRQSAYFDIRSQVHDLKGTEFVTDTRLLPPTSTFARPLLGSVGDATAELIQASKGRVQAGDSTGLSGLQRALDAQLSGTTGITVRAAADGTGAVGAVLARVVAPVAGTPVRLTLQTAVQKAADATLAAVRLPAALVAMQPSTGKILAVANSSAATDDIALVGQYPAGSTFKIVTYTAAFSSEPNLSAASTADCPKTVTVDGRTFENENQFSHGVIPLSAAFGYSCNTTAISEAMTLPTGAVQKAAAALGLGASWKLPVDAFSGSAPTPASQTEKAAEAIGQGRVLVSPLLMASIVGASATGTPVAPSLLADQPGARGATLPAAVTANMNTLLRATVALPGATGYQSLNDLPGQIRGKTGTAEFGTDTPPKSHSWFVGVRGDLAIAVFVYGGENSDATATPLARSFFTAVP